ncbi:MAG: D-alanyl-D-alanine carboxypeptidase [Zoogloeaceae bacterium]|nr:D-alanyl-D-alanine carboxypeptidase [Zoogloeaceae bacterium]
MRVFAALCLSLFALVATAQNVPPPTVAAKAWLLLDQDSGQILAAQEPDTRIEPASLTKLMTAYLTFAALKQGTLKLDQVVPVSTRAWKMEGSRMFIAPDIPVTVDELIHGMIIQSGNDACVALAEAIAGSEETFAAMMNREAQRLGMTGTQFMNSSGMPHPQHYTTARDLATLASALIHDFPENYKVYSTKEYTYNKITQPNRNRLLWLDTTVDGVKTGHTASAGYCLISSAKRGPRRLISVMLGTASDDARTQESLKVLNYGFQFFDTAKLYSANQAVSQLRVWKGEGKQVEAGFLEDLVLSVPKGQAEKIQATLTTQQPLIAPIQKGQKIGTMAVTLEGKSLGEYPVVALQEVGPAGWFGRLWDALVLWFKSL